jgi:hypothetical protein
LTGSGFRSIQHPQLFEALLKTSSSILQVGSRAVKGLGRTAQLCRWIEDRNLKRAAVTNAPRANAELTLFLLGFTQFFPVLVIGSEYDRAKPFPDPYLKALQLIGASPEHTFVSEVCLLFNYLLSLKLSYRQNCQQLIPANAVIIWFFCEGLCIGNPSWCGCRYARGWSNDWKS